MLNFFATVDRQAWVRFFAGLGGLVLSFACAIFSTALRESGFVIFSAVLASLALLLAGLVGLYTVPYLGKRVVRERWLDSFEYEITKEGIVYLAGVIVIAIAALNTGNNLLFIIISTMLSAVVISGIASAFTLRRVLINLSMPDLVFAQQQVIARIRISNPRKIPIFSLHVTSAEMTKGKLRWERSLFHFPPYRDRSKAKWVMTDWRLKRESLERSNEGPAIAPLYLPFLLRASSAHADIELTFPRRGVFSKRALAISTRFPFSFVKKTRRVSTDGEVVVLPAIRPVERLLSEMPASAGTFDSIMRGQGHDLYRIRDHVPGETARYVDWKATARSGRLMVREFTKDDDRRVCIVFDNPVSGLVTGGQYEDMVSDCASVAWHLAARHVSLEFLAPDFDGTNVEDFLYYLAVVTPSETSDRRHVPELPYDSYSIVFTAIDWNGQAADGSVFRYGRLSSTP